MSDTVRDTAPAVVATSRELGRTGIALFPIGLGAMNLSMGARPSEAAAIAVIHAALDAGVNLFDTANVYCASDSEIGHNERLIAKAFKSANWSHSVVVASKGGVNRPLRKVDGRPDFLRASCIDSLRNLGRDTITLYHLHAPDDQVPIEESIGELSRLREEGKIEHIGLSNASAAELLAAQRVCRIESLQNGCNPFNADDYRSTVIDLCGQHGISYLPHSGFGGTSVSSELKNLPFLADMAERYGATPHEIILAWHLAKSDRVIPIPGARHVASARSIPTAARLTLAADDIRRIDALSPPTAV